MHRLRPLLLAAALLPCLASASQLPPTCEEWKKPDAGVLPDGGIYSRPEECVKWDYPSDSEFGCNASGALPWMLAAAVAAPMLLANRRRR
jgi:hypothetical protein